MPCAPPPPFRFPSLESALDAFCESFAAVGAPYILTPIDGSVDGALSRMGTLKCPAGKDGAYSASARPLMERAPTEYVRSVAAQSEMALLTRVARRMCAYIYSASAFFCLRDSI